ncbi:Transcription factor A, mitochondrial [Cucumispora dikerogammari]|nr:Transcription factor A, mitochondrial [Cucumispora dikerogammari]
MSPLPHSNNNNITPTIKTGNTNSNLNNLNKSVNISATNNLNKPIGNITPTSYNTTTSVNTDKSKTLEIPKKPKTGFFEFVAKNRGDEDGENKEIISKLSLKWNSMSDTEKEVYNSVYKKKLVQYNKEIEQLKSTPEGRALLSEKEATKKEKRTKKALKLHPNGPPPRASREVPEGGRKKRVKRENKKPRKMTPYNLFVKEHFKESKAMVEKQPEFEGKAAVGAVVKVIAEKWNGLSEEKKDVWVKKANEANDKKEKENL